MKKKSEMRFEQLRWIVGTLVPSLPKGRGRNPAASSAVVYACWHYASGRRGEFDATNQQLADATGLTRRGVIKVMTELERGGAIETVKRGYGHRGSLRKFTWKPYVPPDRVVNQKAPLE